MEPGYIGGRSLNEQDIRLAPDGVIIVPKSHPDREHLHSGARKYLDGKVIIDVVKMESELRKHREGIKVRDTQIENLMVSGEAQDQLIRKMGTELAKAYAEIDRLKGAV